MVQFDVPLPADDRAWRPLWWAVAASFELRDHAAAGRLYAQALATAEPVRANELRRWGRANGLER